MTRSLAAAIALAATAIPAAAASPCTQQALTVEGASLTVEYCVSGAPRSNGSAEVIVPTTATYTTARASQRRAVDLHFIAGEGVSRVIESLDLAPLGLTGMLHLTLAYSRGLVTLEGALLTPGAITIK
jgi:hypothetical protein